MKASEVKKEEEEEDGSQEQERRAWMRIQLASAGLRHTLFVWIDCPTWDEEYCTLNACAISLESLLRLAHLAFEGAKYRLRD